MARFLILVLALLLPGVAMAQDFGSWHVGLLGRNSNKYVRLWTTIPKTGMEFEILLPQSSGYRYYEEYRPFEVEITRMIDTGVYQQDYKTPDQVKKLGSFMLDEAIYPVGLDNMDQSGELITFVDDLPDDFLDLLYACNNLMFRQVSGIVYLIPMDGFREALAYAKTLLFDYNDPSRHPCYPLIHSLKLPSGIL